MGVAVAALGLPETAEAWSQSEPIWKQITAVSCRSTGTSQQCSTRGKCAASDYTPVWLIDFDAKIAKTVEINDLFPVDGFHFTEGGGNYPAQNTVFFFSYQLTFVVHRATDDNIPAILTSVDLSGREPAVSISAMNCRPR